MDNYNYPMGADCGSAPWNEGGDNPPREIDVTVSITMSKTFTITVDDYSRDMEVDEEGYLNEDIDYSNCNLIKAVNSQICLPDKAYKYLLKDTPIYKELKGWTVDDLEVIPE